MDPYRRFHRRFLNNRQGLNGVIGGLFPTSSADTPSSAASQSTGNPGGIIGGLTSLIDGASTRTLPSSAPSSTATSSTPLTHSSSSSTGSTPASASTASTSSTTSSASTVSSTPTPIPTSTASVPDIVYTSSDGTSVVYVTSTLPAASATAAPPTSFLQNPSMEGGVFTLVGIVALIIIFVIVTWTIRSRRRNRLERDLAAAVTFDPGATGLYERQEDSMEKHRLSPSSSAHGHSYGHGYGMTYLPQREYHGPTGYGQYPATVAYRAPSPSSNPIPYQTSSPAVPQPVAQGGANLTRKFSDRKPVPPLFPDPAYDPNAHVSVSPRSHQQ